MLILVDESTGFRRYPSKTCPGTSLLISGAHTTPIDCYNLCVSTSGCGAFQFSSSLNQCEVLDGCTGALEENDDYDTYSTYSTSKYSVKVMFLSLIGVNEFKCHKLTYS